MSSQKQFQEAFETGYSYAKKIASRFSRTPEQREDLLQEFSLHVLSNEDKYKDIIKHKITVYRVLGDLYRKEKRQARNSFNSIDQYEYIPELDDPKPVPEYDHISYDGISQREKETEYLESMLYKIFNPKQIPYDKQVKILKEYNNPNVSVDDFCKQKKINRSTLMKLVKDGPKDYSSSRLTYTYEQQVDMLKEYSRFKESRPWDKYPELNFCKKNGIPRSSFQNILNRGARKAISQQKYTFEEQEKILQEYHDRNRPLSTRAFCEKHGISTGTLHRLKTYGPVKHKEPISISIFKMRHIENKSIDEIAKKHGISKHSVSQQISKTKKALDKVIAADDYYAKQEHIPAEPVRAYSI